MEKSCNREVNLVICKTGICKNYVSCQILNGMQCEHWKFKTLKTSCIIHVQIYLHVLDRIKEEEIWLKI